MTLQSLQNGLDNYMILLTDIKINHDQVGALASYGHNLLRVTYVDALLLANSSEPLTYSSKRDLQPTPSVYIVVYAVVFNLLIYTNLLFSVIFAAACYLFLNKLLMLLN